MEKIKTCKLGAILLIFTLLVPSVYAEGPIKLKKGSPAPEDGYFFTLSQEQKIRTDLIKLHNLELQLELKDDLILNYKNQIQFHIEAEKRYKEAWKDSEEDLLSAIKANQRNKFLYLLLGIGLTVGAGLAIGAAN